MQYLQQGEFEQSFELLQKAEVLSIRDDSSKAITFNNFACYYRRRDRPQAAFTYLEKALAIEARLPDVKTPADTYLNMYVHLVQNKVTATFSRRDYKMEYIEHERLLHSELRTIILKIVRTWQAICLGSGPLLTLSILDGVGVQSCPKWEGIGRH
jgi:tetratricopeptide (TPR) repeat protein